MGLAHEGLRLLIKKNFKVDVGTLAADELVLCLNHKGDKLKVVGGHGLVIGYIRAPGGQKLMRDALRFLPATFGGQGFDYDRAVKMAIEAHSWRRERKTTNVLKKGSRPAKYTAEARA
jgi:hypothetical protein